ncbi:prolyl oligopeptidase family serine peptidase [Lysobacter sp. CA199]|uniref:carboxylesterase family protein n=1 Tax=Lysobacter sp. CA199 TaxID=3455608 RepID=UPI003F8D2F13
MPDEHQHGRFLERAYLGPNGIVHRYQVFVPSRNASGERPAIILFVHGSGERGDDNRKQVEVGLAPVVRKRMDEFPAIVVFPQMHKDQADADSFNRTALAILDRTQNEFDGDPARTYMTGLSMGGYASFELAIMQPDRFAAVVPICGGYNPAHVWDLERIRDLGPTLNRDEAVRGIAHLPFWIFHGTKDDAVPPQESRDMVAALKRAGAQQVRYTEFPDADHNSWDLAYAMSELWTWLFAQRKK